MDDHSARCFLFSLHCSHSPTSRSSLVGRQKDTTMLPSRRVQLRTLACYEDYRPVAGSLLYRRDLQPRCVRRSLQPCAHHERNPPSIDRMYPPLDLTLAFAHTHRPTGYLVHPDHRPHRPKRGFGRRVRQSSDGRDYHRVQRPRPDAATAHCG